MWVGVNVTWDQEWGDEDGQVVHVFQSNGDTRDNLLSCFCFLPGDGLSPPSLRHRGPERVFALTSQKERTGAPTIPEACPFLSPAWSQSWAVGRAGVDSEGELGGQPEFLANYIVWGHTRTLSPVSLGCSILSATNL